MISNLDFLNANTLRAYPLREGCSALSEDGQFTLPENFLVDASFSVTSEVADRYYISAIGNFDRLISITVSRQPESGSAQIVGTFQIDTGAHQRYQTYWMQPNATYVGAYGMLVIGEVTQMLSSQPGIFNFTLASAEFEAGCVVPSANKINRIVFQDERGIEYALTGHVNIVARNNLRFRMESPNTVILDAGEGLGLNDECDILPAIRFINNIPPDANGNFVLAGSDCAKFTELSSPQGLMLSDVCCKPCLGCDEIDELTKRTMQVESELYRLMQSVNDLNTLNSELTNLMSLSCEC